MPCQQQSSSTLDIEMVTRAVMLSHSDLLASEADNVERFSNRPFVTCSDDNHWNQTRLASRLSKERTYLCLDKQKRTAPGEPYACSKQN